MASLVRQYFTKRMTVFVLGWILATRDGLSMPVNIDRMRYFVAVVEHGSLTAASKRLFVSPQALSKAIRSIEREYGVSLMEKKGRVVAPTEFGYEVFEKAVEALSLVDDLDECLRLHESKTASGDKVDIAIATVPCRAQWLSSSDFDRLRQAEPDIRFNVHANSGGTCLTLLEDGLVDMAVVFGGVNREGFACRTLFSFCLHVIMDERHALAEKPEVSIADLAEYDIASPRDVRCCRARIVSRFGEFGIAPRFVDVGFSQRVEPFLRGGGLVFVANDVLLARALSESGFAMRPLRKCDSVSIPLCCVWRRDDDRVALGRLRRYLVTLASRIRKERFL